MVYNDLLKRQYRTVQLSGATNMFDMKAVQYNAYHNGMYELVTFISDEGTKGYVRLQTSVDWDSVEPIEEILENMI